MTLQQIVRDSGHTLSKRTTEFTRLATAVQSQRLKAGVTKTGLITRTTALWVLMQLDVNIRQALLNGGVDQKALGEVLSVRSVPAPAAVDVAELHEYFAQAMLGYLAGLSGQRSIGLADLATAILHAGRRDSGGLLPERLRDLKVDLDTAVRSVERLITPVPGDALEIWPPPRVADADPFDLGFDIGARGRRLNPYVTRDTDKILESHLSSGRAVVISAAHGAERGGVPTKPSTVSSPMRSF